jgi:hypothetical protein
MLQSTSTIVSLRRSYSQYQLDFRISHLHFIPGPFHPSWPLTGLHGLCNLGQLILQSATGVLVLVLCFVERKEFCLQIVSKLGSSFSVVPFVIVVVCPVILIYWIVQRLLNLSALFTNLYWDAQSVDTGIMYHPSHGRFTTYCPTSFFPHSSDKEGKFWYISLLSDSIAYWVL